MIPRVLSITVTDPTGGAGVQADLKSIAAHGGYGMAVVTPLVAHDTHGTGCSLSSGMATRLGAGDDRTTALHRVKTWLLDSLAHADELHVGSGHGPVHHFHALWERAERGTDR